MPECVCVFQWLEFEIGDRKIGFDVICTGFGREASII